MMKMMTFAGELLGLTNNLRYGLDRLSNAHFDPSRPPSAVNGFPLFLKPLGTP